MTPDCFRELVEVYADGELTDAEAGELRAVLERDPAARERMREQLRDHVLVRAAMRIGDEDAQRQRVGRLMRALRPTGRRTAARAVLRRWHRGRVWPRLAMAALVMLAVGLICWTAMRGDGSDRLRVADRHGQVEVTDQAVSTGADGGVALLWPDGSRIDLHPRTRVERTGGILVAAGEVDLRVAPQRPGDRFAISTPEARVVVLGTRFGIRVDGHGTRLQVAEGTVAFTPGTSGPAMRLGPGQVAIARPRAEAGRLILTTSGLAAIRAAAAGGGAWAAQVGSLRAALPELMARPVVLPGRWEIPDWHQGDDRKRHEQVRREISTAVLTTWSLAFAARLDLDPSADERAAAWLAAWCRPGVELADAPGGQRTAGAFGRDEVVCFELPLLVQAADLLRGGPGLDPALEANLSRWFAETIVPAAGNLAGQRTSFNRVWGFLARISVLAWDGHPEAVRAEMLRLCADLPELLAPAAAERAAGTADDLLGRCLAGILITADIDRTQNGNAIAVPDAWGAACRIWLERRTGAAAQPTPIEGLLFSLRGAGPWRMPDAVARQAAGGSTLATLLAIGRADEEAWR